DGLGGGMLPGKRRCRPCLHRTPCPPFRDWGLSTRFAARNREPTPMPAPLVGKARCLSHALTVSKNIAPKTNTAPVNASGERRMKIENEISLYRLWVKRKQLHFS